jgi:UDP-N-acetylglucosamine 1-carboxyvinyltransferase
MDKIVVRGGKRLKGSVTISGSKNAALPILIATLLTDEKCVVRNIPGLADINTTIALLAYIGKNVSKKGSTVTVTSGRDGLKRTAPYELVRRMRASNLVMGPLLARLGSVKVSLPGGCAIGARPIDIHLDGFAKMGAGIKLESGYVELKAGRLAGTKIKLRYPSVGATENLLLASATAAGTTVIKNAAKEPEISDLADVLSKMGADIKGAGTSTITVRGVSKLSGFTHSVIPDRIETATYLIASAITGGDVTLNNTNCSFLGTVIDKLKRAGLRIECGENFIRARVPARHGRKLKPVNITTGVYPGFPTDVQAQWMALMTVLKGKSTIRETVFENRFIQAIELQRLGADLRISGNTVRINGVNSLSGAPVMVSDLRAGAALVLAGLVARGRTDILRIYHLDRGYEHIERKLRSLGAAIRRIKA